ncbi:MAG: non-canonical purine NTP diphosphatase [Vicingus serpentipes]|nr:non-canonical purine NTP diphosphatase [Vicingus serpentipes]
MKLVFATNNKNKIKEIKHLIGDSIELLSLEEINCNEDIPETSDTIPGNALQKARYVYEKYGYNCFADDTGLEIEALNGAPGIYSARYAGEQRLAENNMNKVLSELNGIENREAQFKTVIALIVDGQEHLFEGIVQGEITPKKSGSAGFGYDPIFQPEGYDITFSEMSLEEKNKISHRGKAVKKLIDYLTSLSLSQ